MARMANIDFPQAVAVRRRGGAVELYQHRIGGERIGQLRLKRDTVALLSRIVEVVERVAEGAQADDGAAIVCRVDGRIYAADTGCRRRNCSCVNERPDRRAARCR
jgi:hypothetical protein